MGRQPEYNGGVISENISGIYLVGGFNHEKKQSVGKDYPIYYGKKMFRTTNHMYLYVYIYWEDLQMENGPFIDGLPVNNGDFPWLC